MIHINPKSVDTYLSGIANQLETHFLDVRSARKSPLVSRALQGVKRRYGVPTLWKLPLTTNNLLTIFDTYDPHPGHDDLLVTSQLSKGTSCLMHLAELTSPDKFSLHDYRKVSMCHSVEFFQDSFGFWLPGNKSDKFFEGNCLIVRKGGSPDTYSRFRKYLSS
jgi:hypothetical protein